MLQYAAIEDAELERPPSRPEKNMSNHSTPPRFAFENFRGPALIAGGLFALSQLFLVIAALVR